MDKLTLNKKLIKIVKRTNRLSEKDTITSKRLNSAVNKWPEIEDSVREQLNNNVKEIIEDTTKNIETLGITEKNQHIEKINLKGQLQEVKRKIKELELDVSHENFVHNLNQKPEFKEEFRNRILKLCLNVCMVKNTPPHIIRGYAIHQNTCIDLKPFELDIKNLSENEVQQALWQITKQTSDYIPEWEKLFFG